MITTITGDNAFARKQFVDQIREQFIAQHGDFAVEQLDGDEATYEKMCEALQSMPFLVTNKLVILKNPGNNKQFAENIEAVMGTIPETTDVILNETKLDKRLTYYKTLKKQTEFREFLQLDEQGLASWLVEQVKLLGGNLDRTSARHLVERVGTDQMNAYQEIKKLLAYAKTIDKQSIDLLTQKTSQSTIFELLDASLRGDTQKALQLYDEQRLQQVQPQQIIAMLAWQLHILAIIKTAGDRSEQAIASEARMSPFVVGKSRRLVSAISFEDLKRYIKDLFDIDLSLKRSSVDPDEALKQYIVSL